MANKLEQILKDVDGKTVVRVSPTPASENVSNEEVICNAINVRMGSDSAVFVSSRLSDEEQRHNELMFRNSPNTNFMVVVDMCNTGWDFPELNNVIDLTFTKNPAIILQIMSRTIRKADGKTKQPRYIYCADQSKSELEVLFYIGGALELTTEEGIRNYDGKVYIKKRKMKSGKDLAESGKVLNITATDYMALADKYKEQEKDFMRSDKYRSIMHKTIFRKALSDIIIKRETKYLDYIFSDFFKNLHDWPMRKKILDEMGRISKAPVEKPPTREVFIKESLKVIRKYFKKEADTIAENVGLRKYFKK